MYREMRADGVAAPSWTALPRPAWRALMAHLSTQRSLFACSLVCRDWAHAADEHVRELRGVSPGSVERALARFDRATALEVDVEAINGDAGLAVCVALGSVPGKHSRRVERLALRFTSTQPANQICTRNLADALDSPDGGTSWGAVRALSLSDGALHLNKPGLSELPARLPALAHLALHNMGFFDESREAGGALFQRLESLELAGNPSRTVWAVLACIGGNALARRSAEHPRDGQPGREPPRLRRLIVRDVQTEAYSRDGLWALDVGALRRLEELEVRQAPFLTAVDGLGQLSALTRLVLQHAPLARRGADGDDDGGAGLMRELALLTQLRELRLCYAPHALHRLPSAVSALTGLTSLELGMRLNERDGDGPEPEDLAPLGRGAPAALGTDAAALAAAGVGHGPLRCFGLRRLVVRGFRGPLHLPEGLERFTALEELDLGGRQTVSNLGPWLLHMPALRRVVVPARWAAQGVFEALELRNDPHQVEVVEDPHGPPFEDAVVSSDDDDEDGDDGDASDGGGWGGDGEPWADEGF